MKAMISPLPRSFWDAIIILTKCYSSMDNIIAIKITVLFSETTQTRQISVGRSGNICWWSERISSVFVQFRIVSYKSEMAFAAVFE